MAAEVAVLLRPHLDRIGEKIDRVYDEICALRKEQEEALKDARTAARWNRSAWN